ncbi:benzyl alcohol O-benzoyltransferase-like isoform X1 [Zingiber officinale]|uniref:Uncharacterized protein n=1 Tax=Zingiber officinale TaxID=94328 RepID=A0A8J5H4V7_ZINOF|nr:benzyl alcohol O-benzoyltransferase-like isoform X1 [Zingiber officinale]KAG6518783.1 hypothetical protein ZIOFF_022264 [Zingiber officinale]
MAALSFTVRRKAPLLVPPAAPTPYEFKRLSDIDDQDGIRTQIPIIQYYRGSGDDRDPVVVIRHALSRALVFFYPLAGRIQEIAGRKLVVECTGEGVLFVEADADVRLDQIGDALHPPIPFFDEVFPESSGILHRPLIHIQVTRLRCGGFIFALRGNHTMTDGAGLGQFLTAIGELARGASAPSTLPVWARELLEARTPPRITCLHPAFDHAAARPPNAGNGPPLDMEHRSFLFRRSDIGALRMLVPPHLRTCSTFEILTACLWRCRTVAIGYDDPDEEIRVIFTVGARGGRCAGLGLPRGYYGNAFAYAAAVTSAGELCSRPMSYPLELMRNVKASVTTEHMRSLADLMVLRGRPHYATEGVYLVSDATRTGMEEVDYGWGKAAYAGPAWGRVASFHILFRNSKGEEGILVPHYLPRSIMDKFAGEVASLIKKDPSLRSSL